MRGYASGVGDVEVNIERLRGYEDDSIGRVHALEGGQEVGVVREKPLRAGEEVLGIIHNSHAASKGPGCGCGVGVWCVVCGVWGSDLKHFR